MSNLERITAPPEALGEFLASLNVAGGPWEEAFHRMFCDGCPAETWDAENCPYNAERDNPTWWLTQAAEGEQGERRYAWRNGLLNLGQGVIIPLENPLRAHIRVKGEESPLGQMLNDEGAGGRFRSRLEGGGKSQKSTP